MMMGLPPTICVAAQREHCVTLLASLLPFFRERPCGYLGWLRLGVEIERIKPGTPQQNGRHERMHLTLKLETTKPAAGNFLRRQPSRKWKLYLDTKEDCSLYL
jgi:transposase InsO family protein